MNPRDRDRMARLYESMSRLPWWNRTRTLTVADLSEFASNMEELQLMFRKTIMAISRHDVMEPDEELDALEQTLDRMNRIHSE